MKTRLLLILLAATLIASACVKVDMRINVADDGSADISGIVALNADAFTELAEDFGEEAFGTRDELCAEFTADQDLDEGGTDLETKPYDSAGFCGVEFAGSLSAEQVASEMGAISGGNDIVLTREGEGWFFEMVLTEEALGTGDLEGAEELFDVDDLFGEAEYVIRVRLPGTQVDHNGDFIEGDGTVGWDIDLLNPPDRLFLRTEPGDPITGDGGGGGDGDGGGNAGLVILIVVLALGALGAGAYFLMRNKKEQSADPLAGQPGHLDGSAPVIPPVGEPTGAPMPDTTGQSVFDSAGASGAIGGEMPVTEPTEVQPVPEPEPPQEQATSPEPQVVSSPTPEEATGSPVWDPTRGKYVQWDPAGNRWLAYDNDTGAWQPE